MKLQVAVFLCCFAVVCGWTAMEIVKVDPDNPSICVSKDQAVGTMNVGEVKTVEGRCVRASCGSGLISYAGCGKIVASKECIGPEDLSKPHPECCPGLICR